MKKVHNDLGRAYAHRNYMGLIDITFNNFENGAASRNARAAAGGIWNSEKSSCALFWTSAAQAASSGAESAAKDDPIRMFSINPSDARVKNRNQ
jgi:hypothetical protein